MKKEEVKRTDLGAVKIHNEVISAIASLATLEIDGVVGMSSSLADGLAHILGKKGFEKGVKAEVNDDKTKIDISVVVKYGASIPEVVSKIQKNVKKNVEEMTGLDIEEINVNVQAIHFSEKKNQTKQKKTEEKESENIK
jgi:uncharacterized alkaline shock family protein YloU